MTNRLRKLVPLAVAVVGMAGAAVPGLAPAHSSALPQAGPIEVGGRLGHVTLKDIRYLPRTLDELGGRSATVLVFTTTTCPIVQRYLPRLEELSRAYAGRGVAFAAVNVGSEDSIQDMALQALDHGVTFPFLKDEGAEAARNLGITRTPQVVVLDEKMALRYRGRIDSQYRLTGARPGAGRVDLVEALEDVLAGREVRVAETVVDGCAVTFEAAHEDEGLTYAADIAPIITQNCAPCHRPGAEAPFPLLTYDDVAARAEMVAEVVGEGRMPPWFAHPDFGEFENERRLTPEERRKVVAWAASGAKPGNLSTLPESPLAEAPKWTIEPDLVIEALWPERIPADGFIPYRYVVLPYVFTHDTWVQGIEIMPGNRRVVHHANLGFLKVGEDFDAGRNFLTGHVPGGSPMEMKDANALLIPAGSVIGLQIHYVTTGKPETDRISVGLRFAKEPVRKQVRYLRLVDFRINIPPGAPAHEVRASRRLSGDATLLGLFTHMHLRGKDTSFIAHHPSGEAERLLVVPNYSFEWQLGYRYAPGAKRVPGGTVIECVSHYDNSPFNPFNPDPSATVRTGLQTHDEMMEAFVFYTLDDENLSLPVDPATGRVLSDE